MEGRVSEGSCALVHRGFVNTVRTFGFVSAVALLSQAVGVRAAEFAPSDGMELVESSLPCTVTTYREDPAWEMWNGTDCMYGVSRMEDSDTSDLTDLSVYKSKGSASDNSKGIFSNATAFNGNISRWNTSAATSMFRMFEAYSNGGRSTPISLPGTSATSQTWLTCSSIRLRSTRTWAIGTSVVLRA